MSALLDMLNSSIAEFELEDLRLSGYEDPETEFASRERQIASIRADYKTKILEENDRYSLIDPAGSRLREASVIQLYNKIISDVDRVTIKATKKAIGENIKWTSSRYNEHKKPEIVSMILNTVKGSDEGIGLFHFRGGSYSASAHGYASRNRCFVPKTYGVDCHIIAINNAVLFWTECTDNNPTQVFTFETIDYCKFTERDKTILKEYADHCGIINALILEEREEIEKVREIKVKKKGL